MGNYMHRSFKYPFYFILPALAIYLVLYIYPTLIGSFYSLTDWNLNASAIKFIGLRNYRQLFSEPLLLIALKNTMIFAFFVTIFQNIIGLLLALALNEDLTTRNYLRTIFYTPVVITPIIVGYVFSAIYNPDVGILNRFLAFVKLNFLAVDWLNDLRYSLFTIIITELWRVSGFAMVIYLAGLQSIPRDLPDQAGIDGAGYWGRFRHIIFPLLAPSFTVNFVLSLIGALKVFEIVFVLTRGGPGYSTEVFNIFILRAFSQGTYGYATAANMMLSLTISVVGLTVLHFLRKREVEM